jgi:hypothetical protein
MLYAWGADGMQFLFIPIEKLASVFWYGQKYFMESFLASQSVHRLEQWGAVRVVCK